MNDVKQVIVMRRDLKMRRGKEIAQGAHAAMAFLTNSHRRHSHRAVYLSPVEESWIKSGSAKICVRVNSEEELLEVLHKANSAGLGTNVITDEGRTEFHGTPTITCLAIGPDFSDKIDLITGDLELL